MGVRLLEKTRKINQLLRNNAQDQVVFDDVCTVLAEILRSNVVVLSKKGKILGICCEKAGPDLFGFAEHAVGEYMAKERNQPLLAIAATQANVPAKALGFSGRNRPKAFHMVVPAIISGERLGTVVLSRSRTAYGTDDIILGEYGAAVVGLEMLHATTREQAREKRKERAAKAAVGALSASEITAAAVMLKELSAGEQIVITSRIAEKAGITRSVIISALRKLEGAEVLESHSSGMKGTFIKVNNEYIYDAIKKAGGK